MNYTFVPMRIEYAEQICSWIYEQPYSLYSFEASEEWLLEFMNGDYYAGFMDNELIGFICSGHSARVGGGYSVGLYDDNMTIDIGLGMRPNLTGKGKGLSFLLESVDFFKQLYANCSFQLVVASFNERAITVYERAGFRKRKQFSSIVGDEEMQFIWMQLDNHSYET